MGNLTSQPQKEVKKQPSGCLGLFIIFWEVFWICALFTSISDRYIGATAIIISTFAFLLPIIFLIKKKLKNLTIVSCVLIGLWLLVSIIIALILAQGKVIALTVFLFFMVAVLSSPIFFIIYGIIHARKKDTYGDLSSENFNDYKNPQKLRKDGKAMSLFGFKEKKEIERLKSQIADLESQLTPEQRDINELNKNISNLSEIKNILETEVSALNSQVTGMKKEIIQLDDEILFQSFALYRPIYDFANSEQYKDRLAVIRLKQKEMIKQDNAVSYFKDWRVDGSLAKGRKKTKDNVKQILRAFNTDCENAIDRVKFNNVDSMRNRIIKSFESLNKLNETNIIRINQEYLETKLEELNLAIEYAMKKQEEKEDQKRIREELREQAKLEKELEETRKNIQKEQKHYSNALVQVENRILSASDNDKPELEKRKTEILLRLEMLEDEIKKVDYREKMPKAGYVYVISNIGSFGENIYKIGMTRRLEPMERVNELGDASVPFNFDVHAMIFTEDAPALESAIHKAFESKKINFVNTRREFFNVTLDEIKDVITKNFDKTVEFTSLAEAEQYRLSKKMREEVLAN